MITNQIKCWSTFEDVKRYKFVVLICFNFLDVLPTMVVKETNDGISDHTHIETQTYLTSVSAAEIGNQLAGATGFEGNFHNL